MNLAYTDEQAMLRDSADRLLDDLGASREIRTLRDAGDTLGYVPETWARMVEQGWPGVAAPMEQGGWGLGQTGLGLIMEALGRTLTPSPVEATLAMGIPLLQRLARSEEHKALLKSAVAGETRLSLAVQEGAHFDPPSIATTARRHDGQWLVDGRKDFVPDAGFADRILVIARMEDDGPAVGRLGAMALDPSWPGVTVRRVASVDSRHFAEVSLAGVCLPDNALIGALSATAMMSPLEDIVAVQTAAQLLGISCHVFRETCDFLRAREQFGVKIGSFQALQHRAAMLYVELECARGLVRAALAALDEAAPAASSLASAAKAKLCVVSRLAVAEAIQMHGGIGVTDELDLGLYLKRATVLQHLFGDRHYHTDRFARLKGY